MNQDDEFEHEDDLDFWEEHWWRRAMLERDDEDYSPLNGFGDAADPFPGPPH